MIGAAIDLGSNSFICLVFEILPDGQMRTLHDEIIMTRLSEGVDKTKSISASAMQRAELAFQKFHSYFNQYKVEKVLGVATSAARDAQNQSEFLALAQKYEIPVQILSGQEEAQMTFEGVKDYFADKNGLVIDIGGGSTEYIWVASGKIQNRISLDMGAVRFAERFDVLNAFAEKQEVVHRGIAETMDKNEALLEFKNQKVDIFLAVSGTPTSLGAILQGGFDTIQLEGLEIGTEDLFWLEENYSKLSLPQRLQKYPFIEAKRADVLPVGNAILMESLKFFEIQKYKISTRGIRHGAAKRLCETWI